MTRSESNEIHLRPELRNRPQLNLSGEFPAPKNRTPTPSSQNGGYLYALSSPSESIKSI